MTAHATSGTATVLFTDLVRSTEILSRLGEAAFDELRRDHFAVLRAVIETNGGVEVKTLGDGVLTTFASAANAVAAAVALQQAVDRSTRRGVAEPLAMRVGVALGDVSFEDGDVFGTPVVEAARLAAVARAGQILATSLVRAVAGARTQASFRDLGLLELKGLPEPVAICEVAWDPLARVTMPLPALMTGTGRVFVGRASESEQLHGLWKETVTGERRLVLIGGEPGVGKTRLAAELAAQVHLEGAMVLVGRCDEDLGVPYQPFVEALRYFVTHTPARALGERLGRHAGELVRLAPELAGACPALPPPLASDPETERYRLFDAVAGWLEGVSLEMPVMLVLDDLQWAAKATLLLLRHLVRTTSAMRLLVVGTYRDTELSPADPLADLLADLRRDAVASRLSLAGLDTTAVAAYLEAAGDQDLDDEGRALAQAIWAETEGNPFFVGEVLRHLAESGGLVHREGRWITTRPVADLGIPEGVREVIGRRLSRLSAVTNDVLRLAAVTGVEFEAGVIQVAGGLEDEVVASALDEAIASRLVVDVPGAVPRCRFAHALVRATLYDELTAVRRAALHRKVAEALEGLYGAGPGHRVAELAHHWLAATRPADVDKALDYARWAGEGALAALAPEEAVRWFSQALELLSHQGAPDQHLRAELLIGLGNAQRLTGDVAHRETLLEAARLAQSLNDTERLVRSALANNRGTLSSAGAVDAERVATLEAALAATAGDSPERAGLLATLAVELTEAGDWPSRRSLAHQAVAMARRINDPDALVRVFNLVFFCLCVPETLEERLVMTAEAVALAEGLGDPALLHWAYRFHVYACAEAGDLEGIDAHLPGVAQQAAAVGDSSLAWAAAFIRSGRSILTGNLDEAEALAAEALQRGTDSGMPEADWVFAMQLLEIRRCQDRLAEMEESFARAADESPNFPALRPLLAGLYCELAKNDSARALLAADAANDFAAFPYELTWLTSMAAYAEVCARLAEIEPAGRLYERLGPWHDQFVFVSAVAPAGAVALYLGMLATVLGRDDDAEAHFAEAMEIHERLRAPYWIARTRLEHARLLATRAAPDDNERASVLLDQVDATAVQFGFAALQRHSASSRP